MYILSPILLPITPSLNYKPCRKEGGRDGYSHTQDKRTERRVLLAQIFAYISYLVPPLSSLLIPHHPQRVKGVEGREESFINKQVKRNITLTPTKKLEGEERKKNSFSPTAKKRRKRERDGHWCRNRSEERKKRRRRKRGRRTSCRNWA